MARRLAPKRKAKLRAKIDELNSRLQDKAEDTSEQMKRAKPRPRHGLYGKAAKTGDAKRAINVRITQLREEYERSEAKVMSAVDRELRNAADKIEGKKTAY
jgi:hypothetical protein